MNEPDPLKSPALEHRTLLWLVVGVSAAFAVVLLPYIGAVLWAVFIAIVFGPAHQRALKRLHNRKNLAALLTLLVIVVIVILPLAMLGASIVQQASVAYQKVRAGDVQFAQYFQRVLDVLPGWLRTALDRFGVGDLLSLQQTITDALTRSGQAITTRVVVFGQDALDFFVAFFVMLYLLFFLLRDGTALEKSIASAVPLQTHHTRRLLDQFATVVRATVKGNIVIALIQGVLGGAAFWVLGLPGPLLWGALMAMLSLLPAVGAALVWVPVAIYYFATGALWAALGLTLWGVLVIGLVDNLLRPVLVGRDTRMPDYLVLIATLGGIAVFGLNGFVIGPVIAAMFLVAWDLFSSVRRQRNEVQRHAAPVPAPPRDAPHDTM